MNSYQELVDSLTKDEWMMLQGLAWIYAGVNQQVSPLSTEFSVQHGISSPNAARDSLRAKGLIDEHYEIKDRQFLGWIWRQAFGGIGVPPQSARMYRPCYRLDDSVIEG